VCRALAVAQENQLPCFSVINSVGSLIARTTKCGVYLNAGREVAVASTKAFTCQVTCMALIAVWFSSVHGTDEGRRKALIESIHRLPTNVGMTLNKVSRFRQFILESKH
jgi:glucosamine--fructose-6-phosphate aminotransferase (isomerizing)